MGEHKGRGFNDLFNQAVRDAHNGNREECERVCRQLLSHADLADQLKAGCHYLLGHGTENYVWHAEQALDLYKNQYKVRLRSPLEEWEINEGREPSEEFEPSEEQKAMQTVQIGQAQRLLEHAKARKKKVDDKFHENMATFVERYERRPTDEELVNEDMKKYRGSLEAYFAKVDRALESLGKSRKGEQDTGQPGNNDSGLEINPEG